MKGRAHSSKSVTSSHFDDNTTTQGLQSIQAQKLSSPVFSTSVAFTATLTQIASDPELFTPALYLLGNQKVKGRDLRLLAIISLALGGGIAQSLLDSSLGLSGSVAVCAGFKIFLTVSVWGCDPGQSFKGLQAD